jgi:hypothetical protein
MAYAFTDGEARYRRAGKSGTDLLRETGQEVLL